MVALSLINLIYTAWIYLPLNWEPLLHTVEWALGLIALAIIFGVCWVMLGVALWRGSKTEIGRIA